MKKSEALRIAQHNMLIYCPVETEEQREILLDVLSVLNTEERIAVMYETHAEDTMGGTTNGV